jgi:CheY-like chemotaxis protein/signal transduction histidine kinase
VVPVQEYDTNGNDPRYLNLNLQKCLQSIRNAAVFATQEASSSQADNDAIATVTRELVSGCAENVEYGLRATSPTSSEEASETSCLDKEVRRLKVLKSYLGALDSDHGNKFERLTALASRIFKVPMALVTVADLDKQYCISSRGVDNTSTRKSPFCSHAVLADCDILVVTDAARDCRFANDPLVTGYPKVRFYAGAPLVCPEGYRLGALCVMDTKARAEVTLEEKQSLMELAAMAMETLVDLLKKKEYALKDPSQQIACTAHDLLTPLTGIALSLSLLKEDEALQGKLSDQQRDMIETAANCSAVMNNICHKTMDFFRDQGRSRGAPSQPRNSLVRKIGPTNVRVADLVKNLNIVMEPFPKQVPIIITVDPAVPPEFVSDDIKIFRSATNFLTNACAKTESGSIHFRIYTRTHSEHQKELVFECEDTGPGVDVVKYAYLFKPVREESDPLRVSGSHTVMKDVPPGACRAGVQNTGLGLYSVATQIGSIGGKYGFRPRGIIDGEASSDLNGTGSIFWFSIPLAAPQNANNAKLSNIVAFDSHSSQSIEQNTDVGKIEDGTGKRARFLGTDLSVRTPGAGNIYGSPSSKPGGMKKLKSEDALEVYVSTPKNALNKKRLHPPISSGRRNQALVIEDSLVVRKSLSRVLSKLGFEVTQAVNGMEGLEELKASLFDLVLCDFLMPVMDGLDCIQQYRQWEAEKRPYFRQYIVGTSAHASDKDVEQGFKIGMNEFRSKPVTYKQLTDLKNGKEFNRISLELDKLGHEIECLKRRKVDPDLESRAAASSDQRVCLVVEGTSVVSNLAELASEKIGWKIVSVRDPESALGLLKMRNWDAVLMDDELGCGRCIAKFRAWEKTHRVNRQNNAILMSANYVHPQNFFGASFQVPTGFDGALGKPIQLNSLQTFLQQATTSCDIVTR